MTVTLSEAKGQEELSDLDKLYLTQWTVTLSKAKGLFSFMLIL
jgi:hypothetical protein